MIDPTHDELVLYDEISELGDKTWNISANIEGLKTDPKMYSIMLFKRLCTNQRGYTALWKLGLNLEANIVLRSAVETAICIAANFKIREEFVLLMRRDATFTVARQIIMHRESGDQNLVREGESTLRFLQSKLPDGAKPAKLDWRDLSEKGDVAELYVYHRMLSSVSSHVTGLSILRGVSNERLDAGQAEIRDLERKMHLMMMAGALLQGIRYHSVMIEAYEGLKAAEAFTDRLADISMKWTWA